MQVPASPHSPAESFNPTPTALGSFCDSDCPGLNEFVRNRYESLSCFESIECVSLSVCLYLCICVYIILHILHPETENNGCNSHELNSELSRILEARQLPYGGRTHIY